MRRLLLDCRRVGQQIGARLKLARRHFVFVLQREMGERHIHVASLFELTKRKVYSDGAFFSRVSARFLSVGENERKIGGTENNMKNLSMMYNM